MYKLQIIEQSARILSLYSSLRLALIPSNRPPSCLRWMKKLGKIKKELYQQYYVYIVYTIIKLNNTATYKLAN